MDYYLYHLGGCGSSSGGVAIVVAVVIVVSVSFALKATLQMLVLYCFRSFSGAFVGL